MIIINYMPAKGHLLRHPQSFVNEMSSREMSPANDVPLVAEKYNYPVKTKNREEKRHKQRVMSLARGTVSLTSLTLQLLYPNSMIASNRCQRASTSPHILAQCKNDSQGQGLKTATRYQVKYVMWQQCTTVSSSGMPTALPNRSLLS